MKELFEKPELEKVEFSAGDVMTTSIWEITNPDLGEGGSGD